MTYFSAFPSILYSVDGKSAQLITDFIRRVSVSPFSKTNGVVYTKYDIIDGETPESVADKFYGSTRLHWIILLVNEIVDPRYDWCMQQNDLISYCENKYDNIYAIHHWENADGLVVDQSPQAFPVSNFDFENELNEKRRSIKILLPQLVDEFVREFQKEVKK